VDRAVVTRRALCVEDDDRLRALVTAELSALGFAVEACGSVTLAKRALAAQWPDTPSLVLTVDDRPEQVIAALRSRASRGASPTRRARAPRGSR
jgi:DNA-binding response OmpR family regulator